ncbi:MAG: trypsin-like serine protease [Actinomycetota bacterium]|nr:trypsin-like serine protease [Actinomycetota bacterium]
MGEHVRSVSRERCWRLWRVGLMALLAAVVLGLRASAPTFAAEESEEACQPSVIGGTAVPDGKYPFVVALLDKRNGSSAYQQQFCGASLVDKDSVLTAAHCVRGNVTLNLRVTIGRTVLSSTQG